MKIKWFWNLWPSDADTVFEKVVWCMLTVFAPALYMVGQLSCWGVLKNCLQQTVAQHGFFWHAIGFILFLATIGGAWAAATDRLLFLGIKWNGATQVVLGLLSAASLLAYSGFSWWFNVC